MIRKQNIKELDHVHTTTLSDLQVRNSYYNEKDKCRKLDSEDKEDKTIGGSSNTLTNFTRNWRGDIER